MKVPILAFASAAAMLTIGAVCSAPAKADVGFTITIGNGWYPYGGYYGYDNHDQDYRWDRDRDHHDWDRDAYRGYSYRDDSRRGDDRRGDDSRDRNDHSGWQRESHNRR